MSLDADITTDAATIVLDGNGTSFDNLAPLAQITSGGSLKILDGGSFTTAGDLDNAGTVDLAAGTLNVAGNYTQEVSGAYDVGVGGLAAGSQFGQLNVSGLASLDGALTTGLLSGYAPPQGDSYPILTFGSETGDFSAEFGLYFGGGSGFMPTYKPGTHPTELDLVVISELPGIQATVQSSENPSNYGDLVTFTVNVIPAVLTDLVPTGTVTFYDGGTAIDTETLVNGSASFSTSAFTAGTHSIVVQYSGDANFSGGNSKSLAQVVNQAASTTAVKPTVNPSVLGQSVTFTATVASAVSGLGTPTGQVTFYDGTTAIDTETLVDGMASYTTSGLAVAGHSITAQYTGDTDFSGSTSTAFTQTVNPAGTQTAVTTSVNPTVSGQSVTFTATVSTVSPGAGTATGQVVFYDGTTAVDTEYLSGGAASYTTSALSVSGHSITAEYVGNTDFVTSTSTAFTQTVDQDGTTTSLGSSADPAVLGQSVTFTAVVTADSPGSGTPTGSVTFYDGTNAVDTETLVGGVAKFKTSSLALGGHAISAVYGGDTDFTGSPSATITETIKQASPIAVVTSSLTPTVFGQGVTFTATVSATPPATGIPSGQVTFYDGSTPIDTETLVDGSATYTTSALAVGGHTITIHYSGDSTFVSGNSTAITQTVDQADTATTVTPSVNPTDYGQPVTFTATVSAASPGSGTPSGQVTFYDGTTAVDTETLKSGTAGYTTSALSLAGHSITAKYLGNTDFAISTSTAITQTVDQDDSKTLAVDDGQPGEPGPVGELHGHRARRHAGERDAHRERRLLRRHRSHRHRDPRQRDGRVHHVRAGPGRSRHQRRLQRRHQFRRKPLELDQRDGQAGESLGGGQLFGEPERLRPVGDVHGDRHARDDRDAHPDRPRGLLRRDDRDRHRDARQRLGFVHDIGPGARGPLDHDPVRRRREFQRQSPRPPSPRPSTRPAPRRPWSPRRIRRISAIR